MKTKTGFIEGVARIQATLCEFFPPFPQNYFGVFEQAIMNEYRYRVLKAIDENIEPPEFPEHKVVAHLDNGWCDTADAVMGNWMGLIYQLTHQDRDKPFMDQVDVESPLGL